MSKLYNDDKVGVRIRNIADGMEKVCYNQLRMYRQLDLINMLELDIAREIAPILQTIQQNVI